MEQPQRVYLSLHACLLFHWGNNQRDFLLWSGGLISFQHSPQLLTSKEFKLHTVYFGTLEHIKPSQLVGQAAEFRFESKFKPLPVIWQSLSGWIRVPKAFPEDNRRFWLQNQWLSSLGRTQAQLGLVGLVRSNTRNFQVGGSHCWHWATEPMPLSSCYSVLAFSGQGIT